MNSEIIEKLKAMNLSLPKAASPAANYVPTLISGQILYISGQLPIEAGAVAYKGTLGAAISVEEGVKAAQLCALNILAQAAEALGDLDRISQLIRLTGYVNSAADFTEQPKIINGASDLFVALLGPRGRHTRAAVGVSSLPLGAAVEIDAQIAIR